MNAQDYAHYFDRIERGAMTHDDAADMMMASAIGQASGVGRAEVLARLQAQFPDPAALNAYLGNLLAHFSVVLRA